MNALNKFNNVAPYYDKLAKIVFGAAIREAQTMFLDKIPTHSKILVLGGGTGWWLPQLFINNPTCEVWYIDASSLMIERAKRNIAPHHRIEFIHGTERDIPKDVLFDVVVTYFYLDLFKEEELIQAVARTRRSTHTNSIWLASDLVNERFWHALLLGTMFSFFWATRVLRMNRLVKWEDVMRRGGLAPQHQASCYGGFIRCYVYGSA